MSSYVFDSGLIRTFWAAHAAVFDLIPSELRTQPAPASAVPPNDRFPPHILLSAGRQDNLAYVDQPLQARKPVGYPRDFLKAYQPNVSGYLPESLRRQLHKMGRTAHAHDAAGTYSRAILNRLLIDLS